VGGLVTLIAENGQVPGSVASSTRPEDHVVDMEPAKALIDRLGGRLVAGPAPVEVGQLPVLHELDVPPDEGLIKFGLPCQRLIPLAKPLNYLSRASE